MVLDTYLRQLTHDGARDRYGELTRRHLASAWSDDELDVIVQMGFAGYFLIVWDLIRFARESGIRVGPGAALRRARSSPTRLRITDLDPLRYGLIFERFLNPERQADARHRHGLRRAAARRGHPLRAPKYGSDHVAQIVTFQTIKGKQGIRDAARVLGFPASVGDRLCKMYPPAVIGRDKPIERALRDSPELREAYEKEPEAKEIIDTAQGARRVCGARTRSTLPGVVIGDAPLVNYLPLKLSKDSRDDSRRMVTQFDMHGVEKLGLLKMDFLGLRNLSVIEDTLMLLRRAGSSSTSTTCRSTTRPRTPCCAGRHDGRLPARDRRACARSSSCSSPTASRTSWPSWRCTGPGLLTWVSTSSTPSASTAASP